MTLIKNKIVACKSPPLTDAGLQALMHLARIARMQRQEELALQHLREFLDLTIATAGSAFCVCGGKVGREDPR